MINHSYILRVKYIHHISVLCINVYIIIIIKEINVFDCVMFNNMRDDVYMIHNYIIIKKI